MSIKDTVISLAIKAKNLLSGDVDDASESLDNLQKKSKDLRANLKKLEDQKKLISQFEKQQKAVDKTKETYQQLAKRVETLRLKINETGDPTDQFSVQLEKTQAAAHKASRSLSSQTVELNKLKNSLKSSNIDASNLAKSEEKLTREIKNSKSVLQGYSQNMRDMGKATAETEKQASKFSLAKAAYWTAGVLAIGRFTSELKQMALSVFTTGDKFEGLRIQMDALMGSIEGGAKATEWIKEFTKKTPLQLEEVTQTFARLKAFGLDPMDGSMQAIIDQSEKLGGGMERVEGISLALGQAWAKQKLQGEEILQMVERGVPVWDLLEKATGRNTLELQKLSKEGKLGRDVIKALTDEIGKGADGAAAANMGRMTGLVSNLKDEWQLFLNDIAQSGALEYAKQQLRELGDTIKQLGQDGTLKKWAQNISDAFVDFVKGAKQVAGKVYEIKDSITLLAATALKLKLASMFVGFAQAAAGAVTSMGGVTGATKAATIQTRVFAGVLKGALLYAVAEASIQIYKLGDAYASMRKSQKGAAESLDLQKKTADQLTATYKKYSDQVGIAITSTDQWEQLLKSGQITFNETTQTFERTNSALEKQTELQKHNAEVLSQSLLPATERLNNKFTELVQGGANVTDAIAEITKSLDVENAEGLNDVVDVLTTLKDKAQITAAEIETGLRKQLKNLSSDELASIQKQAGDTFKALGVDIKSIINDVDPLKEQFTKLGLDLNKVRNGFTEIGKEALIAFTTISQTATASADDIEKAFDGVFAKTNTTSELEALNKEVIRLGDEGIFTGEKLEEMLKQVEEKINDLTPGVNSLEEAFKELGITSQVELEKTAKSSKAAFDAINNSTAALSDKKAAFIAYAKIAIDANEGVISSAVRVQAKVLGVADEVLKMGGAFETAATGATAALDDVGDGADRAKGRIENLNKSNLSKLKEGVQSVRGELIQMQSASENAIASMQQELARASGDEEGAAKAAYENRKQRLEREVAMYSKLYKAWGMNKKELEEAQEALKLNARIYNEEKKNIAQKIKDEQAQKTAEKQGITSAPASAPAETVERVIMTLNLGGDSASFPTNTAGKEDLIALLEKNKMVTT
ncbi:hypothetical protein CW745_13880 [Psychromonas sp. psych-6C06]|uniref:tape measure protein n=1 Tax=Psychromonas sp. psych-6C06 TaxID=2058089 RepID=UPI000C3233D4|nr:tape measure protein [Psychromonas sp. psych-6C06]PKF60616.1 hypothetical protein CW745_13880 [Psychromonas sp. psych-6C06]